MNYDITCISNIGIYDAKTVDYYLRGKFNLPEYNSYSFSTLTKLLKKQCEEKHISFYDRVEFEEKKIYKIYPILNCDEKLVQVSILHKFGNLCFADHPRLPVSVILKQLKYDPINLICDDYDLDRTVVEKVKTEYGE